jgi:hypothetical protein
MKLTLVAEPLVTLLFICQVGAQVITPMELNDPKLQRLQQKNFRTLVDIGSEIQGYRFPYPFYLSRVLDIDLAKMKDADQRSIRFDSYRGETVLEITGNYYASYNNDTMDAETRLKASFDQVIVPILKIAAPHFPDDSEFASFAIEVSHHVRTKVMGVHEEQAENVTIIIPVPSAQKLVEAKNDDQKQAAVLESRVYLNGEPYALWIGEGSPPEDWQERYVPPIVKKPTETQVADPSQSAVSEPTVAANLLKTKPMRILTPDALGNLQRQNQGAIDRMIETLNEQAHFVPYAPTTFIGFRQGAYLELSINTQLEAPSGTSRYKQAALAFDEHVSHLIRPVLEFFSGEVDFDGVDFSSVVRLRNSNDTTQAVEFFFPIKMMRCFVNYDCSGQQLINSGTVLINGERSDLELQIAEGKN